MNNTVVEKRTVTRFCVPFSVRFSSDKLRRDYSLFGQDINMKGMKVVTKMPLDFAKGSYLALWIEFPEKSMNVQGKVMWVKRNGHGNEVGIHFERIICYDG